MAPKLPVSVLVVVHTVQGEVLLLERDPGLVKSLRDSQQRLKVGTLKVDTADGNSYEFTSSPGFVFVTHPMFERQESREERHLRRQRLR